jgi:hypothetical protein
LFTTPLHPKLLKLLNRDERTRSAMNEFIAFLSSYENFINFYDDDSFNLELRNFHASTHTSTNAGDLILKKVLNKKVQSE